MPQAIIAGHLCLDIIADLPGESESHPATYLAPGRLAEVGPATVSTGGAVPNVGVNLQRLGIDTHLVARVGDDALGALTREVIASHDPSLTAGLITVPGQGSSYTLVIDPPGADRMFLHYPGPNDTFDAGDVDESLLASAHLLHVGYPPLLARMWAGGGERLAGLFRQARALGVTTSLDLTMPDLAGPSGQADWRRILSRVLPHVDFFLPSAEELLFMLRRPRFEALTAQVGVGGPLAAAGLLAALDVDEVVSLAGEALDLGARVVLLKLGRRGLYLRTSSELPEEWYAGGETLSAWRGRQLWAPAYRPREVVSTVGTGDAAIAGFLAALLRPAWGGLGAEAHPKLALKVAAAAGACCVEAPGALAGVETWDETLCRMREWEQIPLDPAPDGWVQGETSGIWCGPADRGDG